MHLRRVKTGVQIASFACTLLVLLIAAGRGEAADQKAILDKIKAHYQAAVVAYDDGDYAKTKSQLLEVIALSKEGGVGNNKIVARSYLIFGVLEVAGFKDTAAGVRYFAKALDISPAIQVPASMATKPVLAAFERAENQPPEPGNTSADKEASAPAEEEKEKPAPPTAKTEKAEKAEKTEKAEKPEKTKGPKESPDKDKQLAEMKDRVSQLEAEKQEQDKELADARARLKELDKGKPDKDKQLAEMKGRASQLDKQKQEQDKQLTDAKDAAKKDHEANDKLKKEKLESDQQLAAAREAAKRQSEATDKLNQAKAESDRQLADAKSHLQQLTKEKLETDQQLATTREAEKKERETREKLEKVLQEAQARDKDRKNRDEQARLERDRLAEGPELPGHFSEAITCTMPDEIPEDTDLFVHCLPRQNLAAKVIVLYYRPGGTVFYNATTMERSKKGWYTALIPGARITGKILHYYVEARDARQDIAANNGKSSSPNVAVVRPAGAHRQ
jgi:hypothetical protein